MAHKIYKFVLIDRTLYFEEHLLKLIFYLQFNPFKLFGGKVGRDKKSVISIGFAPICSIPFEKAYWDEGYVKEVLEDFLFNRQVLFHSLFFIKISPRKFSKEDKVVIDELKLLHDI